MLLFKTEDCYFLLNFSGFILLSSVNRTCSFKPYNCSYMLLLPFKKMRKQFPKEIYWIPHTLNQVKFIFVLDIDFPVVFNIVI